jgi:hypothetical protein
MNTAEFNRWRAAFDITCTEVLQTKGQDYSGDDRLGNFRRLAERLGLTPLQIWAVYFTKHIDAIMTFARTGRVASEPIRGRFADARNYLDLGLAMIEEAQDAAQSKPATV